jgi:hypothetical protein
VRLFWFLFFVWAEAFRRADPLSMQSYRLCIGSRNLKSGQGPTKGSRAILLLLLLLLLLNSVALVRKRTVPTERPPLIGEVSANFL